MRISQNISRQNFRQFGSLFPSWNTKKTITFSDTEDFYIHTIYKGVELCVCTVETSGFCIMLNIRVRVLIGLLPLHFLILRVDVLPKSACQLRLLKSDCQ